MRYCPNCIESLVPQKKRLGLFNKWLVCPVCGYREKEHCSSSFNNYWSHQGIEKRNNVGGKFDTQT